jgi:hypothetical protein
MALSDLEVEVQLESEERASKILSTEMEERGRAEVFVRGTEETGMLCTVMHRHTEAEALCDTIRDGKLYTLRTLRNALRLYVTKGSEARVI